MPIPRWPRAALTAVLLLSACSGSSTQSNACGPQVREPLDPQSFVHILDANGGDYLSDPPTSGPHVSSPTPQGVAEEMLAPPLQVAVLEEGRVLIQWRDLEPAEIDDLATLAGDRALIAPNSGLPDRVVATSWLTKQKCSAVDTVALAAFIDANFGNAPGDD